MWDVIKDDFLIILRWIRTFINSSLYGDLSPLLILFAITISISVLIVGFKIIKNIIW